MSCTRTQARRSVARGYLWVDLEWEIAEMFGDLTRTCDPTASDVGRLIRAERALNLRERTAARERIGDEWWERQKQHQREVTCRVNATARAAARPPVPQAKRGRKPPPATPTRYQLAYKEKKMNTTKVIKAAAIATGIIRPLSEFHIASSGKAMALCGAVPHGMYLLDASDAKKATCPICIAAVAPTCPHCGGKL